MKQNYINKIKNHSIILSNGANAPRRALYYLTTTTCYRGCDGAERIVTDPEYGTLVEYSGCSG